jgi:mono/diheme cytochrome c family protein
MRLSTSVDIRRNTAVILAFTAWMLLASCRQTMADQPAYRPLESSTIFADGSSARPVPSGTIARGSLPVVKDTALETALPIPLTRDLLERGRDRFNIFCSPCHGETGNGQGVVVLRGLRRGPPSLHIDRLRQAPLGHFFDVMTNGFGGMADYAAQISNRDRWAISGYVRVLQFSQAAPFESVPVSEKYRLEAEP